MDIIATWRNGESNGAARGRGPGIPQTYHWPESRLKRDGAAILHFLDQRQIRAQVATALQTAGRPRFLWRWKIRFHNDFQELS
ncbi:hypothetical protein JOS77_22815 [Chromobacterium haemolyticum]|nr:hypothetical protein JOS77_22815 [Chromobacterium haemolyticum]